MNWGRSYPDTPAWVTRVMMLLILTGVILVLIWRHGCELYAEADAAAREQWNCPVSDLIPVREPQKPYWTPDWGVTWKEIVDE